MKITTELFVERTLAIHGNHYDYSLVNYKTNKIKIQIKCNIHNTIFEQLPGSHLQKRGCKLCGKAVTKSDGAKKTQEEFVSSALKIFGTEKYDYSLTTYCGSRTKIEILCKPCNKSFFIRPDSHLFGSGCRNCATKEVAKKKTLLFDEFLLQAKQKHENKYEYFVYSNFKSNSKIQIKCKNCNRIFTQRASHHASGTGCPFCVGAISKIEIKWLDFIDLPERYRHKTLKIDNKNYQVDAYVPETNTIYEFFGDFWHGNPDVFDLKKINKRNKTEFNILYEETVGRVNLFKCHGYNLVYIWENDFNKILKKKKCEI